MEDAFLTQIIKFESYIMKLLKTLLIIKELIFFNFDSPKPLVYLFNIII